MEYSVLGNTGIRVSKLCFGTLTMGPLQNALSPEEGGELLLAAFDAGVNFVDTAELYRTYAHISYALKRSSRDVVVATKTYAYTAELAKSALEDALHGLGRDYIDIFLLHEQESRHTLRGHAEALEYLMGEKSKGRIRAVGLSTHAVDAVHAAVDAGLDIIHPLLNLSGLGILDGTRADMEGAVKRAKEAGLGVYTMKALGGGHLYKDAEEALTYAIGRGHSLAIGMKNLLELNANLNFFKTGRFTITDKQRLLSQNRQILIESHCVGCGKCILSCKAGALALQGDQAVWDNNACILCGYCAAHCQQFCIKMI